MFMGHDWANTTCDATLSVGFRSFFTVAVNCFVLISGWFGIKRNWQKLIRLNTMTTFWVLVLCALAVALGLHTVDLRKDILMLFPVLTKQYWFITVYFALCVVAPALNLLVEHIEAKQFKQLLTLLFAMFVVLPTIGFLFNFSSITGDAGYGIVNFMFLYLTGRYLRLHYKSTVSKYADLGGYFVSALLCGVAQVGLSRILGFKFAAFFSYDTVFQFFGAVFLFMYFTKIQLTSRFINRIAGFCLATYVIHLHPWLFKWLYQDFLGGNSIHGSRYLVFILIMPVLTLIACALMESLRLSIFGVFSRNRKNR